MRQNKTSRDFSLTRRHASEFLALAAIVLVAALLRFYRLGEWSLWGDEAFTLSIQEDGFNYNFLIQSLADSMIRASTAAFGVSEWSARLAPAITGILSIPILFYPIRKLFGKDVALLSAMMLAISPWHLYWSQNARFYSLLLLFYSLGLLFFFMSLEEDKPWYMLVSLVFFGLATRERLLALFFLPIIATYLLYLRFSKLEKPPGFRLRNLLIFILPGIVLGSVFAAPYLTSLRAWFGGFGRINNNPIWISAGVVYYLGLPTVCIATFGSIFLYNKKPRAVLLFGLGAGLPLLTIVGLSPFHYAANRYVFISLTSWIILASLAVRELFLALNGRGKILASGILVLMLSTSLSEDFLYFKYQNGNRDDWKAAFDFVRAHKTNQDLVVSSNKTVGDFYLGGSTAGFNGLAPSHMDKYDKVWIVTDMTVEELYPQQLAWIEQNAQEVANFDVHVYARNYKMRVYLYDSTQLTNR